MKFTINLFLIFLFFSISLPLKSQDIAIKIDLIEKDSYIKGKVTNLLKPEEYKVVVYALTDKWYIHPYANLAEGESFSSISSDGEWIISTVYRGFSSKEICVLVVKEEDIKKLPAVIEKPNSPRIVSNYAIKNYNLLELTSNGWHGKL